MGNVYGRDTLAEFHQSKSSKGSQSFIAILQTLSCPADVLMLSGSIPIACVVSATFCCVRAHSSTVSTQICRNSYHKLKPDGLSSVKWWKQNFKM
jgi:hypothetical protein